MVEAFHRADLLRSHNLVPRHRVLLAGPPGNEKTSLAKSLSNALMVPLVGVRYDGLIASYLGKRQPGCGKSSTMCEPAAACCSSTSSTRWERNGAIGMKRAKSSAAELEEFTADVFRRYVLALPAADVKDADVKDIIARRLKQWQDRFTASPSD